MAGAGQLPHCEGVERSAFFVVTGGSVGFQIGGQAVDLVMLIMNKDGMKHFSSQFALGADASGAGGGTSCGGNTDWKMPPSADVSERRGLFAA